MPAGSRPVAEVVFAAAVLGLGLLMLGASFGIEAGSGYDRIGPRFFPLFVAAGLVLTGTGMLAGALRGGSRPAGESFDGRAGGLLALALVLGVVLLPRAGFILTAGLLFWVVTRAFHSRRPWRDALIGLSLATLVYLAFTRGLGLPLPGGVFGGIG